MKFISCSCGLHPARHSTVDDYAYGGGAGMVLKPEPFFEAVESLGPVESVVLLSARGRRFGHDDAVRCSLGSRLTLLCGHYKDVDQRVVEGRGVEELSVGDFVLPAGSPRRSVLERCSAAARPPLAITRRQRDSHYGIAEPADYTGRRSIGTGAGDPRRGHALIEAGGSPIGGG